jgi:3-hydroxy-9,10-secoandrosta-1,3,5(10)-triene-9,17-dione monooxygenase
MEGSATVPDSIPVPEPDLTPADLLARARALVPMLREQQDEAEERGHYGEAVHEAFLKAGFSRTTQPRRFGGYEFDLRTFLETMVIISTGDPGTGWCLTLGSSHAWLVASHFPERAQAEMFGPDGDFRCPHPATPTGEGRRVDGGYRVSGRWPYASGVPYATWVFATGFIAGDDPPMPHVFAMPRSEVTVLDDWGARTGKVLGMQSSGSNTFVGEDIFVPEHRVVPFDWFEPRFPTPGLELYGNPLYLGRAGGPYHTSLVAPVIGAARAALDAFADYIREKPTTFQPQIPRYQFSEDQRAYGQAMAMTDAAETILYGFADQYQEALEQSVARGEPIDVRQDARWWALIQQAGGLAARAVETLVHRATSSTSGRGQRLGRYFRDVTMYRQHISSQQGDFAVRNAALYLGASDRWLF